LSSSIRTPRPLNLEALSILIIDDQPFFRVMLSEVLRSFGVQKISVALDGEGGFKTFLEVKPDIVITDWMMPKLDGIGLTKKIRSNRDETLRLIPIILVTANNQRSQIDFARSNGIDEFILKPISAKSVCDRLREVVERPRPFVSFQTYTGPCRRRRDDADFKGPFRRFDDPLEIEGSEEEMLADGLRSVLEAASSRLQELIKGLSKSSANIRPIHIAVSEMQAIAEDIGDQHLESVFEMLLDCLVGMNKSGRPEPSVIQTHLHAVEMLLRTPKFQSELRQNIVNGLARMGKNAVAA
jgi:two-component system, chemotaxis family, chemotaxis protein CheY